MESIDSIVENYKRLSTGELIAIAAEPWDLRKEIIPHLQSELLARDRKAEALMLSEYLVQNTTIKKPYQLYSKEELGEHIKERLESGELLESIKIDLKENGVDMFALLESEQVLDNKKLNYLTSLKNDLLEEKEIDEKMKTSFGLTETETDQLKRQLKSKGTQNIVIGSTLVIVMTLLLMAAFENGGRIGLGAVLLIGIGVWRISLGVKQRR